MKMLLVNEMDDYTITPTTENADYLAANLQDSRLSRVTRTTALSSQAWKIDAGVGNTIMADAAAILAHNITSGAATIKIQANATDSWGSPSVDESFTHDAGVMVEFFTGGSYRFWRFIITDASNPDGYIEIGRLFLSDHYAFEELPESGFIQRVIDTTVKDYSQSGQVYTDVGITYEIYEIPPGLIEDTTRQSLISNLANVGRHTPFVLVPDEDNLTKLDPLYCILEDDQEYAHAGGWHWSSTPLQFREVF